MQRKEDKDLERATEYARFCGYEEKVVYSHSVRGCRIYKLVPNPEEGLTGYPMVVKIFSNGRIIIDVNDDYK